MFGKDFIAAVRSSLPHGARVGQIGSAFRIYAEPRLLIIFAMGFASGLPLALSSATLFFWLREASISLTAIGLFALLGTPYNTKFLWAPIIDRFPVPLLSRLLGRRRGWMLVIQVCLWPPLRPWASARRSKRRF